MSRVGYALLIGVLATLRLHALARRVELRYSRRVVVGQQVLSDQIEEGRRLASLREDLVIAGVDPRTLIVPLYPGDFVHKPGCRHPRRACTCSEANPSAQS